MIEPDWKGALSEAFDQALVYLEGLPGRSHAPGATAAQLRAALGGPLPAEGTAPGQVIAQLARDVDPGLTASGSGRYFGFVIGGTLPAALAADWLTTAWDQNAGLYATSPAASVVEEVTAGWLADLFGLPPQVSVGFVTGAQMATFTGLSVGLRVVLNRQGWDLAVDGLRGAPPVRVFAGANRHGTVDRALRLLGLGTAVVEPVATDAAGRLDPQELARLMERCWTPALVCAQVGDVNTGAVDDVGAVTRIAHARGAWVHVDGAFGLWAAASPRLRPLVAGVEHADSWATDAHKWLNVPYDSGIVLCAHPEEHRAAMGTRASYLMTGDGDRRDGLDFGPEHSRRARGIAVHAALRSLGRGGVADLVERSCALARHLAEQVADADGLEVLNDVVLNQVLVRATPPAGCADPGEDGDRLTRRLVERVQADGTAWMSGTTWQGRAALRVSVSNWSTDADDIDRTVATLVRLVRD